MKPNMKAKIFILVLVAIIAFLGLRYYMNNQNPIIKLDDFTIVYDETKSKEENAGVWIDGYLSQHTKWYRSNRLKSFKVVSSNYEAQNYFKINLEIGSGSASQELNDLDGIHYFELQQMIDKFYYISHLTEESYQDKNSVWDMGDVDYDYEGNEKLQIREKERNLEISEDFGVSWHQTTFPFERLLENESGNSIYVNKDRMAIIHQLDNAYSISVSKDGGQVWKAYPLLSIENEGTSYSVMGTPMIVDFEEESIRVLFESNHAMGSVQNIIAVSHDLGANFEFDQEFSGYKSIEQISRINDDLFYLQDIKGSVWESRDHGESFTQLTVPKYSDDVWGFEFNQVFIGLEAPYIDRDGRLVLNVHQGDNGDIKKNSTAQFISKDEGHSWMFDRYVYFEEPIVD